MAAILRFQDSQQVLRLGLVLGDLVYDIHEPAVSLTDWLRASAGDVQGAIDWLIAAVQAQSPVGTFRELFQDADPSVANLMAPVERQEVWAAGVTYDRSRSARQEEALDGGDVYARVYSADRPELFFKSYGEKVVGSGAAVGIRRDAKLTVPEPELAVLLNPALEVVGFSIGNDMSSRDIEGANPLYLPQAKIYTGSCSVGPVLELDSTKEWPAKAIRMSIDRDGETVFKGETHTDRIHRSLADLVEYLGRSNQFPNGVMLLTGTGIVPPMEFGLHEGDLIHIEIDGIGKLTNPVQSV